jgi:hypothetical protein
MFCELCGLQRQSLCNCGMCEICAAGCECGHCDVCDEPHDNGSGIDHCGECGNCYDHCSCKPKSALPNTYLGQDLHA